MLTTLLLASLAVVLLLLTLVIVPTVLVQRFVSGGSAIDEVEERWMRRYGDQQPPFIDAEAVRRLRSISLPG